MADVKLQAQLVQQRLEDIIEQYVQKRQSLIIEGVHLTPDFMLAMFKKYPSIFPFTVSPISRSSSTTRRSTWSGSRCAPST